MTDAQPSLILTWLVIGLVSVLLSALYSGLETGLYCLNKIRLRLRSEAEPGPARTLQTLLGDQTRLLIGLLICNNVANYGATAAAAVLLAGTGLGEGGAELAVTFLVTPILFVCGEMVPKTLFRRHPETLVFRWTGFLKASAALVTYCGMVSLVRAISSLLLDKVQRETPGGELLSSRQQIRTLLAETTYAGPLTGHQSQIAENILGLHQVRLRDVMVPLQATDTLQQNATRDQFLALARKTTHSRLPVCRPGQSGQVLGLVTILDGLLLDPADFSIDKLTADAPKLPPSLNVHTALTRLQRARQPLGLVTDKSGRCLGIVTIKDLVEEIVGELQAW